jgi:hypothetical protein
MLGCQIELFFSCTAPQEMTISCPGQCIIAIAITFNQENILAIHRDVKTPGYSPQTEGLQTVVVPANDLIAQIDKHQALIQSMPCDHDTITCHYLDVTLATLRHSCSRPDL